jgi:hypothetical protein
MRLATLARSLRALLAASFALSSAACIAPVGQARRSRLADPMMALSPDPTETYAAQKLHTSREAAAGGDGAAAGGGCACQ